MSTLIKDLGAVSAYAYAVEKGYTGTEDEFASLMYDYTDVIQIASEARDGAVAANASAQEAKAEAQTASNTANEAANKATSKASEASASVTEAGKATNAAVAAKTAAETAQQRAETAQQASEDAQRKAEIAKNEAQENATIANNKASKASQYATTATNKASEASTSAKNAKTYSEQSQASATTANTKADEASASANSARVSADNAQQSATNAQTYMNSSSTSASKAQANAEKTQSDKEAVESAKSDVLSAVDNAQNYANSAQSASQAIQNMDVEATTLEPDSDATVEKTVDAVSGAVTLTYGIPKGQVGEKGDKGDTGDSGVYIGASAPLDTNVNVWIDSDGEPDDVIQIDDTLTQSGQAADAKATGDAIASTNERLGDLKADLKDITGNSTIPVTAEKSYINLSESTVTMSDGRPVIITGHTLYDVSVVDCAAGDKFTINGHGGSSTRLWGFVDAVGNILTIANASISETNLFLVAPEDSAFLIIHTDDGRKSYYGFLNQKVVADLEATEQRIVNSLDKFGVYNKGAGNLIVFEGTTEDSDIVIESVENTGVVISNKNIYSGTTKNLAFSSGAVISKDNYRCIYQRVIGGNWYTVSRKTIETNRFQVTATVNEPKSGEPIASYVADNDAYSISYYVPSGYNYIFVYLSNASDTVTVPNYQIEVGKNATDYTAHNAKDVQVSSVTPIITAGYMGQTVIFSTGSAITAKTVDTLDGQILKYGFSKSTYDVSSNNLLGNVTIRAAKTVNFSDGTQPIEEWYLLQDIEQKFYMSKDLKSKKYLFTFEPPVSQIGNWSFGIDGNNNIYTVLQASGLSATTRLTDDNRVVNPYVFLASENYETMHEIDFGSAKKPVGWLGNYGWLVLPNKDILLCEYTRPTVGTCNVWHIDHTAPTNHASWEITWSHPIVETTESDSGMKHCHFIQYDFYKDVCYFGTGDSDIGSFVYYSTDNGNTWNLAYGPNKKRCRMLTFVFTHDKVYWASDSYESNNHSFFIAERANNIIDIENATEIVLGAVNKQACYGCVYLRDIDVIVMMDRNDTTVPDGWMFQLMGYDLSTGEIVTLGTITPLAEPAGFRALYVEWYPVNNQIHVGFDPVLSSTGAGTNQNAICGNLGGTSGNGSTRINNTILTVYRKPNGTFDIRFDTIYL